MRTPKKSAPGAAATASEGNESNPYQEEGILTKHIPTPAETLATLPPNEREDGHRVVLTTIVCGPFVAQVSRFDHEENGEPQSCAPEITIDSSAQGGGEMFNDLTVLEVDVNNFTHIAAAIATEYRRIAEASK